MNERQNVGGETFRDDCLVDYRFRLHIHLRSIEDAVADCEAGKLPQISTNSWMKPLDKLGCQFLMTRYELLDLLNLFVLLLELKYSCAEIIGIRRRHRWIGVQAYRGYRSMRSSLIKFIGRLSTDR